MQTRSSSLAVPRVFGAQNGAKELAYTSSTRILFRRPLKSTASGSCASRIPGEKANGRDPGVRTQFVLAVPRLTLTGDGSKEWTPEWLQKLDHRFGDDGDFWIEYKDLLRKYQSFERTRLFEGDWSVAQAWTTLNVPWMVAYHDVYFSFAVSKPGRVVIVLTQLDDRYFRGLEGQYTFLLSFRIHKAGREDYLVRSQLHQRLRRSVSAELDLEAGDYDIRIKIDSFRDHDMLPIEDVVRKNAKDNRDKLTRIGLAYDLAHSKGLLIETAEEKAARAAHEKKVAEQDKEKIVEDLKKKKEEVYFMKKTAFERQRGRELKRRAKQDARMEKQRGRRSQKPPLGMRPNGHTKQPDRDTGNPIEGRVEPFVEQRQGAMPAVPDVPERNLPIRDAMREGTKEAAGDDADPERTPVESEGVPEVRLENQFAESVPVDFDSRTEYDSAVDDDLDSLHSMSVYSGREMEIRATAILENLNGRAKHQPPGPPEPEPDEFESDPWNAVAVVGLRVYHQCAGGEMSHDKDIIRLRVVRPNPYAGDGKTLGVARLESKTSGLDVDDSAKDATLVGEVKDRQKSIMGNNRRPYAMAANECSGA